MSIPSGLRRKVQSEGSYVVNYEKQEPLINSLIKFASKVRVRALLQIASGWCLTWACILISALSYTGCISEELSYVNGTLLIVSMILGGNGPDIKEAGCCPALSLGCTLLAFVTDVFVVAILISKLQQGKPRLLFSDTCVVKLRDGTLVLQFRYMSPFGHFMTNIRFSCSVYQRTTSIEGENYTSIVPAMLTSSNFGGAYPINVTHIIDESSPLWGTSMHRIIIYCL
jgi:hypothetical protein